MATNRLSAGLAGLITQQPDAPALIDGATGEVISYAAMDGMSRAWAARVGDTRGAVVSMLPNSVDELCLFLGSLRAGATFAPLSPQTTAYELERWLRHTDAGLCVIPATLTPALRAVADASGVEVLVRAIDSPAPVAGDDGTAAITGRGAGRVLLRTSGTTGDPKAIAIDGDKLWESGRAFIQHHHFVDANARFLNNLPMSYLGGLFNLGLIPLAAGASTVIGDAFSGRSFLTFWQDVERFEINVLWLVPTIVRGLLEIAERTSRHRKLAPGSLPIASFIGTAPIDLATKLRFEETFNIPLLENYALSETTFLTSERLDARRPRQASSVGEVLPWVQIRTTPVDGGLDGELEVSTPFLFDGYLDESGALEPGRADDGFFRTGDLGHIDDDGTLILAGRVREVIKKGGHLVVLREAEVLAEESPAVTEAAAVPIADDFYGEDYVVFVIPSDATAGETAAADAHAHLTDRLPRHKWPAKVVARDDLPRTTTGKVRKGVLAEEWVAAKAARAAASKATP